MWFVKRDRVWSLNSSRISFNMVMRPLWLFKNLPGTCGFADWQFFLKCCPARFFSFLKKTIVQYVVEKFKTVIEILTSERKRVFLKGKIFNVSYPTVHFIWNLQAKIYRNIRNVHTGMLQFYLQAMR